MINSVAQRKLTERDATFERVIADASVAITCLCLNRYTYKCGASAKGKSSNFFDSIWKAHSCQDLITNECTLFYSL